MAHQILKETSHLEETGVDGRRILYSFLKKRGMRWGSG
jgi:hypothetical protein